MNQDRKKRIIANMKQEGLSQLIVSSTASIYYLTGLWIEPHERMIALYLDDGGQSILFGNEIFGIAPQEGLPLYTHKDGENPVEELAKHVKAGSLGIDKFWSSKFLISLMDLRPDVKPVHGSAPVDRARMLKDAQEIEALRRSSSLNDEVVELMISRVREGAVENQLAAQVNRLYLERGADCEGTQLVCFGPNGADPHHNGDGTVLKPGDSVIFDIFISFDRYWCDMTRTVFYKEASEEQRKVYELVKMANLRAIEKIKPGVFLSEIDKTARDIITEGGCGPYFTHRLGHGAGLECHEPPDVGSASKFPLEPGMVFSVEPGIYLPGKFGVRIEDLVLVTETGCEVLNKASKDLRIVD